MTDTGYFFSSRDLYGLFNAVIIDNSSLIIPDDRFTFWYHYHYPSSIKDPRKELKEEKKVENYLPKDSIITIAKIDEDGRKPLISYSYHEKYMVKKDHEARKYEYDLSLSECEFHLRFKSKDDYAILKFHSLSEDINIPIVDLEVLGYKKTFPSYLDRDSPLRTFATLTTKVRGNKERIDLSLSPTEEEWNEIDYIVNNFLENQHSLNSYLQPYKSKLLKINTESKDNNVILFTLINRETRMIYKVIVIPDKEEKYFLAEMEFDEIKTQRQTVRICTLRSDWSDYEESEDEDREIIIQFTYKVTNKDIEINRSIDEHEYSNNRYYRTHYYK